MKKVEVYEVKAPCLDTSFDVTSGNSNTPIASPKAAATTEYSTMMQSQANNADDRMEYDDLRCEETIHDEGPTQNSMINQ